MKGWITIRTMFCPVTGMQDVALPTPGVKALKGSSTSFHVSGSGGSDSSTLASLQSLVTGLSQSPWSLGGIVSSMLTLTPSLPDGELPLIENLRPPYARESKHAVVAPPNGK